MPLCAGRSQRRKLRAVPVRVNAYDSPPLLADGIAMGALGVLASAASSEDVQRLRSASEAKARRVLDEGSRVRMLRGTVSRSRRKRSEGAPAESVIDAGQDAELLVDGLLVKGSVSQQCAQHPL